MADPLSVAASIAGLLTAAASIVKVLRPYVSAARDTPQIAHHVNAEVQAASIILSSLQSLAQNMASVSIQRAALVEVDQVVAVLTSGVFVFSDIEASVGTLPLPDSSTISGLALRSRFQWARKETEFAALLVRLQSFKSSISLILNILQSDTSLRAEQHQVELTNSVNQLLENSHDLSRRLMNLEDSFDAQTIVTKRRSIAGTIASKAQSERLLLPSEAGSSSAATSQQSPNSPQAPFVSGFEFEVDLKTSGPYRRAQRDTMDFSFCSSVARSHAWSVFSGLSLGDISVMSVIALPVYADEITNSHHYEFSSQLFSLQPFAETHTRGLGDESLLRRCLKIQLQLCQLPGFETLPTPSSLLGPFHPLEAIQDRLQEGTLFFSLCRCFKQFGLDTYAKDCHQQSRETGKPLDYWALKAISESSIFGSGETPTVDQAVSHELASVLKAIDMVEKILSLENELIPLMDVDTEIQDTLRDRFFFETEDSFDFFLLDDFTRRSWKLIQPLVGLTSRELVEELGLLNAAEWQAIFMPLLSIVEAELNFLVEAETNLLRPPWNGHWGMLFSEVWEPQIEHYGLMIGRQPRNSSLLRSRVDGADLPRTQAIAKALDHISLPSRLVEMKSEFLSTLKSYYCSLTIHSYAPGEVVKIAMAEKALERCRDKISILAREEEMLDVATDLRVRVVDWKGLRVEQFGKLLLYDPELSISLPDANSSKPYRIYLFEAFLICCREIQPPRPSRVQLLQRRKPQPLNRDVQLRLDGRIVMNHITDIVPRSDLALIIFWKGDPGIERFDILFGTKAQRELWDTTLKDAVSSSKRVSDKKNKNNFARPPVPRPKLMNPYSEESEWI